MTTGCAHIIGTGNALRDWFAVRVRSNCERTVTSAFISKGFEVCLPLYRARRMVRQKVVEVPIFPGYVFSCFESGALLPVLTVPGVVGIVCCGRTPEPVDPTEMKAVQRLAELGVVSEPYPYLQVGQRVCINDGPLEGVEGFLLRERGADRLVVSVSLLQRSVVAEVERRWVEPAVFARSAA
jgi:transcription antitermination factor NusG